MRSEFELKSLDLALQKLLDDGVLKNDQQKNKLYDLYKNDSREYGLIHEEINKLRYDSVLLGKVLTKDDKIIGNGQTEVKIDKKPEYELSLENITDFEKDGKSYIKIHYPYPYDNVRIIENRTNPHQTGKERFESLQGTQKTMSVDGVNNATSIFEQTLVRDCHEVDMKDIRDVSTSTEYAKLSKVEKEKVYGTIRTLISSLPISDESKRELNDKPVQTLLDMLNKNVYISPSENIVVICERNNPLKDETKTLNVRTYVAEDGSKKNVYSLKPLDEVGYRYNPEDKEEKLENQAQETIEEEKNVNEGYEVQKEDDLDKDLGQSIKMKSPWQKRKKQAAFISLLWFVVFCGMLFGAVIAVLIKIY